MARKSVRRFIRDNLKLILRSVLGIVGVIVFGLLAFTFGRVF